MGLIRAAFGAAGGTLRDQYKEFIYCEALPMDVLMRKGSNKITQGSSNRGNENIISDGSRIAVADGQCMVVVEDGKIMDFCAEAGEYTYNTGTTPSMLTGGMPGLKKSFATFTARLQAGGGQDHDQRVYFINLKEIMGNKVGSGDIPFRDSEFNFTIKLKCFGEYSYKITDPILFYTNVCSNVHQDFTRDLIDSQFKAEIQSALQPAMGRIALKRIAYDQLTLFTKEISQELNAELTAEWVEKRGISIFSFALASVTPDAESAEKINRFQEARVFSSPGLAGGRMVAAQANAMENAASNANGAMGAFMGMGMAQQAGGANAGQLFNMEQQQANSVQAQVQSQPQAQNGNLWKCTCGADNSGKFCSSCGEKAPVPVAPPSVVNGTWKCNCGNDAQGKFCPECGNKRPLDMHCETCGFDGVAPFKFCPECGAENKE